MKQAPAHLATRRQHNTIRDVDGRPVYSLTDGDAEWIALARPSLAGPLAAWLEHAAEKAEITDDARVQALIVHRHALAVAHAINAPAPRRRASERHRSQRHERRAALPAGHQRPGRAGDGRPSREGGRDSSRPGAQGARCRPHRRARPHTMADTPHPRARLRLRVLARPGTEPTPGGGSGHPAPTPTVSRPRAPIRPRTPRPGPSLTERWLHHAQEPADGTVGDLRRSRQQRRRPDQGQAGEGGRRQVTAATPSHCNGVPAVWEGQEGSSRTGLFSRWRCPVCQHIFTTREAER